MIVEKTSVVACIEGLYFKVHELSDDRKRPDTRSVQNWKCKKPKWFDRLQLPLLIKNCFISTVELTVVSSGVYHNGTDWQRMGLGIVVVTVTIENVFFLAALFQFCLFFDLQRFQKANEWTIRAFGFPVIRFWSNLAFWRKVRLGLADVLFMKYTHTRRHTRLSLYLYRI